MSSVHILDDPVDRIERYFRYHLHIVPDAYITLDTNRMTLMYFALAGLNIIGKLEQFLDENSHRIDLIEWIYHQQIDMRSADVTRCGFRGSPALTLNICDSTISSHQFDEANLSQTYTAICSLLLLGDDMKRVHRDGIIRSLVHLQAPDGNFRSCHSGGEADMRFVYCACVISSLLNDWSGFDTKRTIRYIHSCRRYDGGFALQPDGESHGGSTYLAIASLSLMGVLDKIEKSDRESLLFWCMMNQGNGYRGRPNKEADSCYSFWLGASIRLLKAEHMTNAQANAAHLLQCSHCKLGGFSKHVNGYPDLMHSYMALAGLSIIDEIVERDEPCTNDDISEANSWRQWHLRHLDVRLGLPHNLVNNTNT